MFNIFGKFGSLFTSKPRNIKASNLGGVSVIEYTGKLPTQHEMNVAMQQQNAHIQQHLAIMQANMQSLAGINVFQTPRIDPIQEQFNKDLQSILDEPDA